MVKFTVKSGLLPNHFVNEMEIAHFLVRDRVKNDWDSVGKTNNRVHGSGPEDHIMDLLSRAGTTSKIAFPVPVRDSSGTR